MGGLAHTAHVDRVHALLLGSVFAALFLLDLPRTPKLAHSLGTLTALGVGEDPRPWPQLTNHLATALG